MTKVIYSFNYPPICFQRRLPNDVSLRHMSRQKAQRHSRRRTSLGRNRAAIPLWSLCKRLGFSFAESGFYMMLLLDRSHDFTGTMNGLFASPLSMNASNPPQEQQSTNQTSLHKENSHVERQPEIYSKFRMQKNSQAGAASLS